MTIEKEKMLLEVAYDLIERVHSSICNRDNRKENLAEESLEILRRILLLDSKLIVKRSDTE